MLISRPRPSCKSCRFVCVVLRGCDGDVDNDSSRFSA